MPEPVAPSPTGLVALAEGVHAALRRPDVAYAVGAKALHQRDAPPLVTWVVSEVRHLDPLHVGGRQRGAGSSDVGHSFLTRALRVQLHCWHRDVPQLEQLVEDLLRTLHNRLSGSIAFQGEQWVSQVDHEFKRRGELAIVRVEIHTPVEHELYPTEELTEPGPATLGYFESKSSS
ncbi:MAG: hypothetical protein AAGA56_10715 [Myxococcota bacterium]